MFDEDTFVDWMDILCEEISELRKQVKRVADRLDTIQSCGVGLGTVIDKTPEMREAEEAYKKLESH
jgi:hypothetical protein